MDQQGQVTGASALLAEELQRQTGQNRTVLPKTVLRLQEVDGCMWEGGWRVVGPDHRDLDGQWGE